MTEHRADRLPPNQALATPGKWPVVGERAPRADDGLWTIAAHGLVAQPQAWTLDELRELPQTERTMDIHCVTRWSRFDVTFRGVRLVELLERCLPVAEARFISFGARSVRNHSTSLPLAGARELDVLIALEADGAPLEEIHGGPVRTITPGRYFYKSLKWLESIELLRSDRLGYWEADAGYHNHADPWAEERYIASNLDRGEVLKLMASRDFSGRDLLSISAEGRDLRALKAERAMLRNADFGQADLRGACFDGANLSNAHLAGADLRGATCRDSDLEGADFAGADLRGADLSKASLFGATFDGAVTDETTVISPHSLDALTPEQRENLRA